MERVGKKRSNVSRWLFPTHPVAKSNLLDPFLSRSLFAVLPRHADTVSDKNLGLHVNVDSQFFLFLYGLILWPKKRWQPRKYFAVAELRARYRCVVYLRLVVNLLNENASVPPLFPELNSIFHAQQHFIQRFIYRGGNCFSFARRNTIWHSVDVTKGWKCVFQGTRRWKNFRKWQASISASGPLRDKRNSGNS